MFLFVMSGMFMFMGTVRPAVFVVMHMNISSVLMGMRMFMEVLMSVGVSMLVKVNLISMAVLMAVRMSVFVGMQVFVLVLALHGRPSLGVIRERSTEDPPAPVALSLLYLATTSR